MSSHKGSRLGPRVSPRQLEILVEFMERHPYLVKSSCALSPELIAARKDDLWKDVVSLLNTEGPAVKTMNRWCAFWNKETHEAAVHAAEHRRGWVLQDLATGVRALTDAIAQQTADIAQLGDTVLRQTLAQERLATAAEREVQQNDMMLQELRTFTRMAPALLVLSQQSLGKAVGI
ncbi:hypothetical protein HPB49_014886 [Dermacentor silvarum]|uniref:Uncharacterized protein n=1 Tax=Dermacentor silvarum TaxID=543639 RepID=A0ACB8C469_DERSI|nr:hypothetical protein HPB49_014886 [Dermacentor silvarum]